MYFKVNIPAEFKAQKDTLDFELVMSDGGVARFTAHDGEFGRVEDPLGQQAVVSTGFLEVVDVAPGFVSHDVDAMDRSYPKTEPAPPQDEEGDPDTVDEDGEDGEDGGDDEEASE